MYLRKCVVSRLSCEQLAVCINSLGSAIKDCKLGEVMFYVWTGISPMSTSCGNRTF